MLKSASANASATTPAAQRAFPANLHRLLSMPFGYSDSDIKRALWDKLTVIKSEYIKAHWPALPDGRHRAIETTHRTPDMVPAFTELELPWRLAFQEDSSLNPSVNKLELIRRRYAAITADLSRNDKSPLARDYVAYAIKHYELPMHGCLEALLGINRPADKQAREWTSDAIKRALGQGQSETVAQVKRRKDVKQLYTDAGFCRGFLMNAEIPVRCSKCYATLD